jgi:hypothetical protein
LTRDSSGGLAFLLAWWPEVLNSGLHEQLFPQTRQKVFSLLVRRNMTLSPVNTKSVKAVPRLASFGGGNADPNSQNMDCQRVVLKPPQGMCESEMAEIRMAEVCSSQRSPETPNSLSQPKVTPSFHTHLKETIHNGTPLKVFSKLL